MSFAASFLVLLVAWGALLSDASAQLTTIDKPAISIERLTLPPGPGAFIGVEGGELLTPGEWSIAALATLMKDPIVLADLQTGERVSAPVEIRLGYELAAAYGLSPRLQLGAAIPVVAAQHGDRLRGIGLSEEALAAIALSDLRLHAKLRMQPEAAAALAYGVSVHVALPSGDDDNFAGEEGTVLSWSLVSSYRGSGWRIAGNLGLRLRTKEVVLLSPARPHGNEVIVAIAGEYNLPPSWGVPLGIVAELTKVQGDEGGASPGEARGGLVAHLRKHARLKFVGGGGFTAKEVGAPAWRIAVVFERTSSSD